MISTTRRHDSLYDQIVLGLCLFVTGNWDLDLVSNVTIIGIDRDYMQVR